MRVRQIARVALENHPVDQVNKAAIKAAKNHKDDDVFALELMWLMEREKNYADTTLIQRLLASPQAPIRRAAVRSLRWWAEALGSDLPPIINTLVGDNDDRVKIGLVSTLSHLQIQDEKWSTPINQINAKPKTPLAETVMYFIPK